jgi:Zn-dependent M28 family amino/carboxypeptidase
MDNASGIASMIEIARALSKKSLDRTVAFVAVTGEEGGLNGSKHFAAHPTVPVKDIVADINLDMFLPIIPLKGLTVYGMDESDLGDEFTRIAQKFGVAAHRDPQPARNLFIRSDQYSFIRRGVPSLAFKFHPTPGTSDAKIMADWLQQRYHAPSDDLEQPVELESAAQFNRLMTAFVEQTANRQARPRWKDTSFFRRFASSD